MLKKRRIFFLFIVLGIAFNLLAARDCLARNGPSARAFFDDGEKLFSEGNWSAAKENYRSFLASVPLANLTDNALFRLAEIALIQEDAPVALLYLDVLLLQFENSELAGQAKYKKALCQYRLQNRESSIALLNKLLKENPAPHLKYEATILLGDCLVSGGELVSAVENYLAAASLFPGKKEEIHSLIRRAMEEERNAQKLLDLSKSGPELFPHGEALFQLLSLYLQERDFQKFQETAPLFLQRFPSHPKVKTVEETVEALQTHPDQFKTKIGVLLPLSGNAALQGEKILKGIQLAFSFFPSPEEVELVIKDSAGDSQKAKICMEDLAKDPSVIAVLGPAFGKVAEDLALLSESLEIPMLSPAASSFNLPLDKKFFLRNCITSEIQGRGMAEFAVNDLGLKRFVVISPADKYGKELKDSFRENVAAMGGEVLAMAEYSEKDVDFSELIKNIGGMEDEDMKKEAMALAREAEERGLPINDLDRLSLPLLEGGLRNTYDEDQYQAFLKLYYDAIFIPGYFEKVGLIIPQLEFFNIEGVKLLGASGWNVTGIIGFAREHPENFYFVDGFSPEAKSEIVRQFVEQYNSFFGETPDILAAQAYDAAQIIFKAYQSGKKNRKSMREGLLETRDFPGVSGITSILPTGNSEKGLFIMTVRKNKIEEVERRERHGNR